MYQETYNIYKVVSIALNRTRANQSQSVPDPLQWQSAGETEGFFLCDDDYEKNAT